MRIVAPRDTPRHPNKIEMERHEACFKSNSDQEFKYFCLMPCNALFGDKCYPFFRGVLEIQRSCEHQPILCAVENGVLTVDLPGATLKIMLP